MRTLRPVRVDTPPIEVRLAEKSGRLLNISATGALVQTGKVVTAGHEHALALQVSDEVVPLTVRIIRADSAPAAFPAPQQYLVGVTVTALTAKATQTVAGLCGPAFTKQE